MAEVKPALSENVSVFMGLVMNREQHVNSLLDDYFFPFRNKAKPRPTVPRPQQEMIVL